MQADAWKSTVARIQACATAKGRARYGACSLEGTRLFERALRAGATIEAVVTTSQLLADTSPRIRALVTELRGLEVELELIPQAVMDELTDGRTIGAVLGLARLPEAVDLSLLVLGETDSPPFFLGLVGVDDPGNVGALLRTAHASGAAALLTVGTCDAFHPKAVRTSMGSAFRLPVIARTSLSTLQAELRELGVRTFGSVSNGGARLGTAGLLEGPAAVFMGSEAFGLSTAESSTFDELVTIPMPNGVDSFSVNAAAAVLLWEFRRTQPPLALG